KTLCCLASCSAPGCSIAWAIRPCNCWCYHCYACCSSNGTGHLRRTELLMDKNKITLQDYAFFNRLLEGCQIVSRDFRYLFLNEVILEHGKRPWEELLGKTMMEVYPGIENTEMFA